MSTKPPGSTQNVTTENKAGDERAQLSESTLPMKTMITIRPINATDGSSKDYLENFLKPIKEDLDESTFHFMMYDLDGTLKFFDPNQPTPKPGATKHGSVLGGEQAIKDLKFLKEQGCGLAVISAAPQSSSGLGTVNRDLQNLNPELSKIFGDPDFPPSEQPAERDKFILKKERLFRAYQLSKIKALLIKYDSAPSPLADIADKDLKAFYEKQLKNYSDFPTIKDNDFAAARIEMEKYIKRQELDAINMEMSLLLGATYTVRSREEIASFIESKDSEFKKMIDAKELEAKELVDAKPGNLINKVEEVLITNKIDTQSKGKYETESVNLVHYKNILLPLNRKAEAIVVGIRNALSEMTSERRNKIKKIKIHALDDYIANTYQITEVTKYLRTIQDLCPHAILEIDSAWLQLKPAEKTELGGGDNSYTEANKPYRDNIKQFQNGVSGEEFNKIMLALRSALLSATEKAPIVKVQDKDTTLKNIKTVDPKVKKLIQLVRNFLLATPTGKDPSTWKEKQDDPHFMTIKKPLGLEGKTITQVTKEAITYIDNGHEVTKTLEELYKMSEEINKVKTMLPKYDSIEKPNLLVSEDKVEDIIKDSQEFNLPENRTGTKYTKFKEKIGLKDKDEILAVHDNQIRIRKEDGKTEWHLTNELYQKAKESKIPSNKL